MMEQFGEWGSTLKDRWKNWGIVKRIILILVIASLIGIGVFSYYALNAVEYSTLFSNISEQDAGTITQDLQKQGIKYKLEDNGKTILIEKEKVDEYRINLAVDNKLPNSTQGFELFDNASMMTTDEDRKIMYQRAVTGELQRAIETLSGVQKAKVLLVMPDKSVFQDTAQPATASVVLTLKNNTMSTSSVQGIVNLVAGGVENLSPDNVKIVDSNGRTLTTETAQDGTAAGMSDRYVEIQQSYEQSLKEKLQNLLEPVYGAVGFQTSVNLDLNFDATERTTVTYGDTAIRSENVQASGTQADVEEAQTGTLDDNVSNVTGEDGEEGTKSYERSVNNEIDSETTKTVTAPSTIRKMTSSIVINKSLSAIEQQNLQELVASAIGYDAARGDVLSIQGMNFAKVQTESETEKPVETKTFLQKWLIYIVILGIVFLITIFVISAFLLFRKRAEPEEEDVFDFDNESSRFDMSLEAKLAEQGNIKEDTQSEVLKTTVQDQAKSLAEENPELAADLIKAWMKEK
ncbi:flagellar basal-body MS-ring/collar protein FliF [Enterococcus bulliens]